LSANTVPYSTANQTRIWANTYGSFGEVLASTGPRTDLTATTAYGYDAKGNVAIVTNALQQVTIFTNYNGSGLPMTIIDPNGVKTLMTYDLRDRLLTRTVEGADGNATTTFKYDAAGLLTNVVQPDGSSIFYQHDMAHRLICTSNSLGEVVTNTLDAAGNIVRQDNLDSSGEVVRTRSHIFDSLSRLTADIGANSQTSTYSYDGNGNRLSLTDGLNQETLQKFDPLNRLSSSLDPLNNSTSYMHDGQDNLLSVTDPRNLTTAYVPDGFGRTIQTSSPDTGTTVYKLDEAGNRIMQTDSRVVVTLRTFDALNRVMTESFPASSSENIVFNYDSTSGRNFGIGRLTGYSDETGNTTLKYNERGDVISTTRTIGGKTYETDYGYDLADHIKSITYPSRDEVDYGRDSQGRISSVTLHSSGGTTVLANNVSYMPFGPMSGFEYGNALVRTQKYDMDYRLTDITTGGAVSVQNLHFDYDTANDIESITDNLTPANNQTFGYDPDYRLTSAKGLYGDIGYSYDGDGNRLTRTAAGVTETYSYPETANLLQSTVKSGVTRNFGYTPAGNMNSDNRGSSTDLTFNYGSRNRYNTLMRGNATVATYQYNALGQRLIKIVGATTTHFHYDQQGHLIAESQGNGALVREYVWLGDMPLAQIEADGTIYYIHPDQLNTPQRMTSATRDIVWSNDQEPFGETIPPILGSATYNASKQFQVKITGSQAYDYIVQGTESLNPANWVSLSTNQAPFTFTDIDAASSSERFYRVIAVASSTSAAGVTMNLRFPGQYFDAESGLNYNTMRDYDATLGRYLQADPFKGSKTSLSKFAYASNNTINSIDPFGLWNIFIYTSSAGGAVVVGESVSVFGYDSELGFYSSQITAAGVETPTPIVEGQYLQGEDDTQSSCGESREPIQLLGGSVGPNANIAKSTLDSGAWKTGDGQSGVYFGATAELTHILDLSGGFGFSVPDFGTGSGTDIYTQGANVYMQSAGSSWAQKPDPWALAATTAKVALGGAP
jgi:RHS repeat-associated protein